MEKKQYKTPEIKVVEFHVEHGFAGSREFSLSSSNPASFEMDYEESNGARNEQYNFTNESTFWN